MMLGRRFLLCAAFLLLVVVLQCSEGHSVERREAAAEDATYDDTGTQNDGSDDTQNDGENGDEQSEDVQVQGYIVTKPETFNVTVGKSIRLECKVTPEDVEFVIQWNKDGNGIFLGSWNQISTDDKERFSVSPKSYDLLIKDVQPRDQGNYECIVSLAPPLISPNISHQLNVLVPPKVLGLTATNNGKVLEGTDLVITCNVSGSPQPNLKWQYQSTPSEPAKLLTKEDGVDKGNTVLLKNVNREKSGRYYCYALSSCGNDQAEISINILGKPRVHIPKTVVNSAIGVSAILECLVHEDSPKIKWLKDGRSLVESNVYIINTVGPNSKLTVTPVTDSDFGVYTCEASNEYGSHSKSVALVERPVIDGMDVNGLKLSWIVHSHQPLEIIEIQLRSPSGNFTTINVSLPKRKMTKYEITHVLDKDGMEPGNYAAFVKVKNSHGWSDTSEEVPVKVVEDVPQPIQHASVFGGATGGSGSLRPTSTAILSTMLMYLLVRML